MFAQLQSGRVTAALCLSAAALLATTASAADSKEGFFTTNDGYRLHYIEAGSGDALVMIPGWSQTAAQFKYQIDGLSDKYHVIAIDMRGHGESDKPDHGYRIHRLSKDVHDFLAARGLSNVTLAGHSMGSSVIWGYWSCRPRAYQQADPDRPDADDHRQPDLAPAGKRGRRRHSRSRDAVRSPTPWRGRRASRRRRGSSPACSTRRIPATSSHGSSSRISRCRAPTPPASVRPRNQRLARCDSPIDIPTLVVGGQAEPGALEIAGLDRRADPRRRAPRSSRTNEGGNHFMFMENPEKFNRIVKEFMG